MGRRDPANFKGLQAPQPLGCASKHVLRGLAHPSLLVRDQACFQWVEAPQPIGVAIQDVSRGLIHFRQWEPSSNMLYMFCGTSSNDDRYAAFFTRFLDVYESAPNGGGVGGGATIFAAKGNEVRSARNSV